MDPVIVALIAVAALSVLNLVLTLGLIRRYRADARPPADAFVIGAGERIGGFTAVTTDGAVLADADLAPDTVVGFFSPGCASCAELLPVFAERAGRLGGGRDAALAVLCGSGGGAEPYLAQLAPVSRVVLEPDGGPVSTAFGVRSFPALVVLDQRQRVRASGVTPAVLASVGP